MTFRCGDLPALFRDSDNPDWDTARKHAENCPDCAREIQEWELIEAAARELRRDWETPDLWRRIQESLVEEQRSFYASGPNEVSRSWSTSSLLRIAAGILIMALIFGTAWLRFRSEGPQEEFQEGLLTERALAEVEAAETAYLESLRKLQAAVDIESSNIHSGTRAAIRERLLTIDGAAADLRAEIERNRFNARLRAALLSVYKAKQQTLEELLHHDHPSDRPL